MAIGHKSYDIRTNDATRLFFNEDNNPVTDGCKSTSSYWMFTDRVKGATTDNDALEGMRFIRITIPAQRTADGYYKIGRFIAGKRFLPTKLVEAGMSWTWNPNVLYSETRGRQRFTVKAGDVQKQVIFRFGILDTAAFRKELDSWMDYINGGDAPFYWIEDNEASDNAYGFLYLRLVKTYIRKRDDGIWRAADMYFEEVL